MIRIFALLSLLALPAPTLAGDLEGKVIGIVDGDTIDVLDASKVTHRIRLDGIDAPERGQPFGNRAKSAMSDLIFGKTVHVATKGSDKYDRTVGRVSIGGEDVGLAMLQAGMAWQYTKYDQSKRYADCQQSARESGVGLWADRSPVPPWEWRKLSKAERDKRRTPQLTR